MAVSTDPKIDDISIRGDAEEGDQTWIDVRVSNSGTAGMPSNVIVMLECTATPYAKLINPY